MILRDPSILTEPNTWWFTEAEEIVSKYLGYQWCECPGDCLCLLPCCYARTAPRVAFAAAWEQE